MSNRILSDDGFACRLTGDQVRFVRMVLGDSQATFAKRLAMSQAAVWRLEAKKAEECVGPEIVLVRLLAKDFDIAIPEEPLRRAAAETVSA